MDRNPKPNPFSAFDNITNKPGSSNFAASSTSNSGGGINGGGGGFQPSGNGSFPSVQGNPNGGFASTPSKRPSFTSTTSPSANFDVFGFPNTSAPPIKPNPFDNFSCTYSL